MAQPTLAQLLDQSSAAPGSHAGGMSWEEKVLYLLAMLASGQNPDLTTNTQTVDTELPAAVTFGSNMANPTSPLIGACALTFNGTQWNRVVSIGAAGDAATGNSIQAVGLSAQAGTTFDTLRTPNVFKTVNATASGSTAVWTPGAGKKFRLMGYLFEVTGEAAQAGAGVMLFNLLDAAAGIGQAFDVYIPAAAPATILGTVFSSGLVLLGNGILSAAANNVLNIALSAALTGGRVRINVFGTEE